MKKICKHSINFMSFIEYERKVEGNKAGRTLSDIAQNQHGRL